MVSMKIHENIERKKEMKKMIKKKREDKLDGNIERKSALMRKKERKSETTSPSGCLWNDSKDRICEGLCEKGMGLEWAGRMVHGMDSDVMDNIMRYM